MTTQDIKSIERLLDIKLSPLQKQIDRIDSGQENIQAQIKNLQQDVTQVKTVTEDLYQIVNHVIEQSVTHGEFDKLEVRVAKLEQS